MNILKFLPPTYKPTTFIYFFSKKGCFSLYPKLLLKLFSVISLLPTPNMDAALDSSWSLYKLFPYLDVFFSILIPLSQATKFLTYTFFLTPEPCGYYDYYFLELTCAQFTPSSNGSLAFPLSVNSTLLYKLQVILLPSHILIFTASSWFAS